MEGSGFRPSRKKKKQKRLRAAEKLEREGSLKDGSPRIRCRGWWGGERSLICSGLFQYFSQLLKPVLFSPVPSRLCSHCSKGSASCIWRTVLMSCRGAAMQPRGQRELGRAELDTGGRSEESKTRMAAAARPLLAHGPHFGNRTG